MITKAKEGSIVESSASCAAYRGNQPQHDDITLVAIRSDVSI